LVENFFDRGHGLAGAIAGSRSAVDLGGAVSLKRMVNSGPGRARIRDRGEGNHLAFGVLDEKLADIFGAGAIGAFGFDVDLPLASETIEIVDEKPPMKA